MNYTVTMHSEHYSESEDWSTLVEAEESVKNMLSDKNKKTCQAYNWECFKCHPSEISIFITDENGNGVNSNYSA